jgi:hypothetical protein
VISIGISDPSAHDGIDAEVYQPRARHGGGRVRPGGDRVDASLGVGPRVGHGGSALGRCVGATTEGLKDGSMGLGGIGRYGW